MRTFEPQAGMCSCHGRRRRFAAGVALLLGSLMMVEVVRGQSLQDFFTNREIVLTSTGQLVQTNHFATVEAGEPKHGGKVGGRSLWISWVAPTNGVVEFETEASGFDTLLSAYEFTNATGATFAELREVARADDSEGFEEESEIEFAVYAGDRYEIAVDGYFGAVGTVELKWKFEPLPHAAGESDRVAARSFRQPRRNRGPRSYGHQCDGQRVQVVFQWQRNIRSHPHQSGDRQFSSHERGPLQVPRELRRRSILHHSDRDSDQHRRGHQHAGAAKIPRHARHAADRREWRRWRRCHYPHGRRRGSWLQRQPDFQHHLRRSPTHSSRRIAG